MDDLIAFVTARVDEDEAAARAAKNVQTEWYAACDDDTVTIDALREHIGRSSPARALREVEAKRAILAQREHSPAGSPVLVNALYQLAAVWSDHPDYRPEWKP